MTEVDFEERWLLFTEFVGSEDGDEMKEMFHLIQNLRNEVSALKAEISDLKAVVSDFEQGTYCNNYLK